MILFFTILLQISWGFGVLGFWGFVINWTRFLHNKLCFVNSLTIANASCIFDWNYFFGVGYFAMNVCRGVTYYADKNSKRLFYYDINEEIKQKKKKNKIIVGIK